MELVDMLVVDCPEKSAALGPEDLKGLVERALKFTQANGITSENAVKVFLALWIEYGEGFPMIPDRPWAEALFAHPTLPDVLKVAMVRDRFRERVQGRRIEIHGAPADPAAAG